MTKRDCGLETKRPPWNSVYSVVNNFSSVKERFTSKKTSFYGRYHVVSLRMQRYGARNAMSRGGGDYFAKDCSVGLTCRTNRIEDTQYSVLS